MRTTPILAGPPPEPVEVLPQAVSAEAATSAKAKTLMTSFDVTDSLLLLTD